MNTSNNYIAGQFKAYSTQLASCSGIVDESRLLLGLESGQTTADFHKAALAQGLFPELSASRVKSIISGFVYRYSSGHDKPLFELRSLVGVLSGRDLAQIFHLHTARTNAVYHDFMTQVYWKKYRDNYDVLTMLDARNFIDDSHADGRINKPWAESTKKAVASSLLNCCVDFDLLYRDSFGSLGFRYYSMNKVVALYLAYYLHHLGFGDNAVITHHLWAVFGLDEKGVRDLFNKDSAEFPHLLGGGMNAVQALACWLMKPLHYSPLLVLYTA